MAHSSTSRVTAPTPATTVPDIRATAPAAASPSGTVRSSTGPFQEAATLEPRTASARNGARARFALADRVPPGAAGSAAGSAVTACSTSAMSRALSTPLPGQVFGDPSSRWKWMSAVCSPNALSRCAHTLRVASYWAPSSISALRSKSPTISIMNGPSSRVPLRPVWLAGGAFQLRPVHSTPCGSMVRCCAMSLQPFSTMWKRRIASTVVRPRKSVRRGRQVWCRCTATILRVRIGLAAMIRLANWGTVRRSIGATMRPPFGSSRLSLARPPPGRRRATGRGDRRMTASNRGRRHQTVAAPRQCDRRQRVVRSEVDAPTPAIRLVSSR